MIDKKLFIQFTKDRHGEPLAIVENFPRLQAELYPDQLRALADGLNQAADECEAKKIRQLQIDLNRSHPTKTTTGDLHRLDTLEAESAQLAASFYSRALRADPGSEAAKRFKRLADKASITTYRASKWNKKAD